MKVVIVGGGIAGLSLACLIKNLCKSIQIVHKASSINRSSIGLWSLGAKILSKCNIIDPKKDLCYVKKTSYRTQSGYTLASPSFASLDGLLHDNSNISTPLKEPSLGFLTEEFLLNKLNNNMKSNNNINIEYSEINSINTDAKTIITTSKDDANNKIEIESSYDLLVVADGMYSPTRSLIWKNISSSSFLNDRGYIVYRGTSPRLVNNQEGFQTWGPGRRFAVVPSVNNTNAWYAAVSTHLIKSFALHPLENSDMTGKKDGIECSKDDLFELATLFYDWHDPISSLISESVGPVTRTIAKASPTPYSLFSYDNSNSYSSLLSSYDNVVCIGDAYHTLDPILAQGTGVAIEDAAHLVECLKYYGLRLNKDDGGIGQDEEVYHKIIADALKLFQEQRRNRVNRLHFLSDAAQIVGHIDSPLLCNVRNFKLSLVFDSVTSFFFDKAIMASLGGRIWPNNANSNTI